MAKKQNSLKNVQFNPSHKEHAQSSFTGHGKASFKQQKAEHRYGKKKWNGEDKDQKLVHGKYFGKKWFPY